MELLALGALQVHSVSISKDSSTGLSKGFGFVKYMSKESADKAKATLNGTPLKDFPELKASAHSLPKDCQPRWPWVMRPRSELGFQRKEDSVRVLVPA